jgi:hypothetical protein
VSEPGDGVVLVALALHGLRLGGRMLRVNWPLLQLIGPPAIDPDKPWDWGRSVSSYSTLSWLATPWFKLNFYRPHRLRWWRWVRPDVVRIPVGGPR